MESNKPKLSEDALQARKEYQRRYRREHPDRVRQWSENYWEKKARQAQANKINGDET